MWQKEFCRYDKVKDLEIKNYPGSSGWAPCNHTGPYNREAGDRKIEKGSQNPKDVGSYKKLGRKMNKQITLLPGNSKVIQLWEHILDF